MQNREMTLNLFICELVIDCVVKNGLTKVFDSRLWASSAVDIRMSSKGFRSDEAERFLCREVAVVERL